MVRPLPIPKHHPPQHLTTPSNKYPLGPNPATETRQPEIRLNQREAHGQARSHLQEERRRQVARQQGHCRYVSLSSLPPVFLSFCILPVLSSRHPHVCISRNLYLMKNRRTNLRCRHSAAAGTDAPAAGGLGVYYEFPGELGAGQQALGSWLSFHQGNGGSIERACRTKGREGKGRLDRLSGGRTALRQATELVSGLLSMALWGCPGGRAPPCGGEWCILQRFFAGRCMSAIC